MEQFRANSNTTLLEALQEAAPDSSKTTLRSWIKQGRITVNGCTVTRSGSPVSDGELIELGRRKKFAGELEIVYDDPHVCVVNKPAGLLSVSTDYEDGFTAHAILKDHFRPKKIYVIHRLDRETSGLMVFAKSEKAFNILKEQLAVHSVKRQYIALIEGTPSPSSGVWKSKLIEGPDYVVRETKSEDGRESVTHYQVLKTRGRYTLLQLNLETGRKNQIRVHCKSAGCPVVGDKKYGSTANPLKRLGLHAELLEFLHPITEKPMRFQAFAPAEFGK